MNIIYATDGSIGSVVAGDLLARMALGPEDRILVLAVATDPAAVERLAAGPREALHGAGAQVSFRAASGDLSEQIRAAADQLPADLVALGAISEPGPGRSFTWALVERLVRQMPASLLIARPPGHGLARVLVGVELSEADPRVVATAAAFPLPDAELRLVTVLPPEGSVAGIAPLVWTSLSGELQTEFRSQREAADSRLRELAAPLQQAGRQVAAEVVRGEAGASLVSAAAAEGADVIAVGSRGQSSVERLVLGSVAGHVARCAQCSVLMIP